jgi:hypothetical protein
MSWK